MASYSLKTLREESAKIGMQARTLAESVTSDMPEARQAEVQTQVNAMLADYDKIEARIATALKLEQVEADLNAADPRRPSEDRSVQGFVEAKAMCDTEAFHAAVRCGGEVDSEIRAVLRTREARALAVINGGESRAQSVGTGAAGGYLVPVELANQIIVAMRMAGPMMDDSVVNVVHTDTGATMNWPTLNDTANQGYRISEGAQVTANSVTLGQIPIQAWKYSTGVVQYSSELAQDSAFDINGFLSDAMVVRAGRVANLDLTVGLGASASAPNGLLTAIGNAAVATANAGSITFDDVVNVEHSVDPAYRNNPGCRFQFHDTTFKALRLVKDNFGRYIWEPATALGAEPTLFGYKYSINQAFPVFASGNKIIAFGDHKRYLTRITKDFALRLLVERYADYDQLGLIGFMRIDGNLLDQSGLAINCLKLS